MAWHAIPDTDIDGNSALKTNHVLRYMRDAHEALADGSAPTRFGLYVARTETPVYGYIRPDGDGNCELCPVEAGAFYVIDDTNAAWPIPAGARQITIELWGAGGATGSQSTFDAKCGFAGAYGLKLLDVDHAGGFSTLDIQIGASSDSGGGADTVVTYKGVVYTAQGGEGNGQDLGFATAINTDIIIGGGAGAAVRGGHCDPDTGYGVMGGAGAQSFSPAVNPGGKGRVIVRVLG